jgi:hypothetical protein
VELPRTLVQSSRPGLSPARRRVAAAPDAPAPADLVLDRYRLLRRLGAGGFGTVWSAHDELLGRDVAVKRVPLGPDGDDERAAREALAAARLSHPAIVALHEACAVDGAFYLISELVHGHTLAHLIAEQPLEDEQTLQIALALTDALAHAHAHGVIHRDIKPQNVLVPERRPRAQPCAETLTVAAKLTDFGGASLVGEEALTRTGDVLGTLAYMAPEQSEGGEVREPADLYSLALVTYEALGGVNPVRGATPADTVRRIGRRVPPLSRARPDLPDELTASLDRALAASPRRRGTLEQLARALDQARAGGLARRTRRTRTWPAAAAAAAAAPAPAPAFESAPAFDLGLGLDQPPSFAGPIHARAHAPVAARARVARPPDADPPAHERADIFAAPVRAEGAPRAVLPRSLWLAAAALLVGWQAFTGRPGLALVLLAALAPLLIVPTPRGAPGLGVGWLAGALAPVLGLAGLAGAYPAVAGQAPRWRERASLGALGYWWLVLAGALADSHTLGRLWLGPPAGTPAPTVWEGSLQAAAAHVLAPLLVLGVLLGAALWAIGAAVLPWLVRGRSAALDVVAVTVWSAALAAAAPMLDSGLRSHGAYPQPRGLVVGAVLGGLFAVAARALRGPV